MLPHCVLPSLSISLVLCDHKQLPVFALPVPDCSCREVCSVRLPCGCRQLLFAGRA